MQAHDYQNQAARTLIDKPDFTLAKEDLFAVLQTIAMNIRAGNAAELVKKGVFHQHGLDGSALVQTIGRTVEMAGNLLQYKQSSAYVVPAISDSELMLLWNVIGLLGEAGEVAATVNKAISRGQASVLDRHTLSQELSKELGDVLWYIAALCTKLDLDMSEIMEANIEKLKRRYPTGYSSAASIQREE